MNTVLGIAEHYIASGIKCFPVCIQNKIPRISNWTKHFLNFEQFKSNYLDGDGIGVLCGRNSWMVCIDIDTNGERNGMPWYEANKDRLGHAIVEHTGGGGLHLYYNYPKGVEFLPSSAKFAPGVEIMAEGRYVITAPSGHASGNKYTIHNGLALTDIPFECDELPQWIIDELLKKRHKELENPGYINGLDGDIVRAIEAIRRMSPAIQGQQGDYQTFIAACECRRWGLTQIQAFEVLGIHYNPKCVPPWSTKELKQKIHNAYTYHGGEPLGAKIIEQGKPEEQFQKEEIKEKATEEKKTPYTKSNILDLIDKPFPPKEHIIGPFVKQGLNMVYAPPGVGKTHFALSLAFAIATGTEFLHWKTEIKQKVIYFDGELPGYVLKDRIKALLRQTSTNLEGPIPFEIVTPDEQGDNPMPDLSTNDGQNEALKLIGDSQFIVIDNISTLCRTGKENEAESWIPVQSWILKLRRLGKSVLLVHHSGKGEGASPRGTSKREDVLDLVISLSHPTDYKPEEGCKFEIKFRKSRHYRKADDIKHVVATLTDFGWSYEDLEKKTDDSIETMFVIHEMSQKAIAEELKISKQYVSKIIRKRQLTTLVDQAPKVSKVSPKRADIDDTLF